MKDNGPEGRPPPDNRSRCERIVDKSVPVPEPNLNSMASLVASRMMSSMLSCTLWIKQADPCGNSYGFSGWYASPRSSLQCQLHLSPRTPYWWNKPTLNHTGELNDPCWCRQSQVSSR